MPIYTFINKETNEIQDLRMSIKEYSEFKSDILERHFDQAPSLGDPVRLGLLKPSGAFNEVLSRIHERTPYSKLNENLSRNP